jgi:hypothetical protein
MGCHRGRPGLVATALLGASAFGLSACDGNGGQALARQACVHVQHSLVEYRQSTQPGVPATTVAKLQQKAGNELQAALPLAAQANSADGTWNSLMTTISENATIDEGHLVPSLEAQCKAADSNQNVNPQPPGQPTKGSTPNTANVNPQTPSG